MDVTDRFLLGISTIDATDQRLSDVKTSDVTALPPCATSSATMAPGLSRMRRQDGLCLTTASRVLLSMNGATRPTLVVNLRSLLLPATRVIGFTRALPGATTITGTVLRLRCRVASARETVAMIEVSPSETRRQR